MLRQRIPAGATGNLQFRSWRAVAALWLLSISGMSGIALSAQAADYGDRNDVRAFIKTMVSEHGFMSSSLKTTLRRAHRQQAILDAISRPAEHALAWKDYRKIFLTQARISQGVEFWRANEAALARAESLYAVSPEIIVAIIGVETSYGRNTGTYRVLDALATLAFDYPPRAEFFRGELGHFLLLAREQRVDPTSVLGSYAGAMGFAQFMPSSYRNFAVDFDADGAKDLWHEPTDAIGSIANYFREHGWQGGKPVVQQMTPPATAFDAVVAGSDPEPKQKFGELVIQALTAGAIAADEPVALFRLEGDAGPEYWLGMRNFYVITRYNHSPMYALAVFQLASEIVRARGDQAADKRSSAETSVSGDKGTSSDKSTNPEATGR